MKTMEVIYFTDVSGKNETRFSHVLVDDLFMSLYQDRESQIGFFEKEIAATIKARAEQVKVMMFTEM